MLLRGQTHINAHTAAAVCTSPVHLASACVRQQRRWRRQWQRISARHAVGTVLPAVVAATHLAQGGIDGAVGACQHCALAPHQNSRSAA